MPILSAVRIVGGRLKPWDAIVEAMLARTLPFEIRDMESSLFERIRVNVADLAGPASQPITRPDTPTALTIRMEMGFPFVDKMTKRDAGEVLNLGVRQYTRLLIGYRTSFDRNVPIADVVRIAGGHVTNTEIAARLGITYQAVRLKAAALGITRLSEAGYGRQLAERLLLQDGVDT